MRTTVRLQDDLLRQAKRWALEHGQSLTSVLEDALRTFLNKRPPPEGKKKTRLTTVGGQGVYPGVDIDDTASLLDRMEHRS